MEERQRQETQRMQDEQRRQDSQRQDEQRRQEERRRHGQKTQEERRKQESPQQSTEHGGERSLNENTVRTLQNNKKQSEQNTIEYAQKHGVPIAPASLSMSGRERDIKSPQGERSEPTTQENAKPQTPQKGGFAARREALKPKVQEALKKQEQSKTHDIGRGR